MPNLAYQDRIEYCWEISPPLNGSFPSGFCVKGRDNTFRALNPGDTRIKYRIKDVPTEYYSDWSNWITLHLVPKVTITIPLNGAEFSYDQRDPGILSINVSANVIPSLLGNQLTWKISKILGSDLISIPHSAVGTFEYSGLPQYNSQYGLQLIVASLPSWNVADTVRIFVYYMPEVFNHRGGNSGDINWFHYWNQTSAGNSNAIYGGYQGLCYSEGISGFYDPWDLFFYICARANGQTILEECAGRPIVDGIDKFGAVAIHENSHLTNWINWYINGPYEPEFNSPVDHDDVPDILEDDPRWDPNNLFSSWFYDSDNDGSSDFEELAFRSMCNWIIDSANLDDWSVYGHQWQRR